MSTPIFYLHIRTRGCTAAIRLNDAPIYKVSSKDPQMAFPTLSEWVINGENRLTVELIELADNPQVHVALCQAKIGDVPEPGQEHELIVIRWPTTPEPEPPPQVLHELGPATHPWPDWSWQRAPAFDTDPQTINDVVNYVQALHTALTANVVDALIDQSPTKFNEVAPIYNMTIPEAQQRITSTWASLSSQPGWQLATFDPADITVRLHCDKRLAEPTTLSGAPILRQARAINGERWSMPILIARTNWEYIANELTIVR